MRIRRGYVVSAGRRFSIRQDMSCRASNAILLATLPGSRCGGQAGHLHTELVALGYSVLVGELSAAGSSYLIS